MELVIPIASIAISAAAVVAAVVYGKRQHAEAKRSADAAAISAEAAKTSAEVASRAEARQTERNDVVWGHELRDEFGRYFYVVTNEGVDRADSVVVVVSVDGVLHTEEHDVILPGESVRLDVTTPAYELAESFERTKSESAAAGIIFVGVPEISIGHRIMWETPAGRWRVAEVEPASYPVSRR